MTLVGQSIFEIFKNSIVMLILLAGSILGLTLVLERFWYFFRNRFNPTKGLVELRRLLATRGPAEALQWAQTQKNPLGRMFTVALDNLTLSQDELSDMLYSLVLEERIRFERLLGGMGTLANAATLLGLLGTVTGLIKSFSDIAATGSGGPAVVSRGIAEALVTTAFGLFIGIPMLFFYNYFSKKAADLAMSLESTSDRLVVMLMRYKAQHEGELQPPRPVVEPVPPPRPQPVPAEDTTWKF
ncbi:MAG: MotA/TolQ/ExbB proton channel family protein [candidate division WOR-3 bacterium]